MYPRVPSKICTSSSNNLINNNKTNNFTRLTTTDKVLLTAPSGVVDHFCGCVGPLMIVVDIDTFVAFVKI